MKIIQISDCHLHQDSQYRIFGLVNTNETFLQVLDSVIAESPDFIIATGDLSQDGSIEAYRKLNTYLAKAPCEVYTIYGNHDLPHNFNSTLINNNVKYEQVLQTKHATFLFLNSFKENFDSGFISDDELNRLERDLNQFDNCIPVIHHHFIELNAIIDKYILENSTALMNILTKYKHKIKFCITGHVHNSYDLNVSGVKVHCGLSTCIQFAQTQELLFVNKAPGYTIYNFKEDGYEITEKTI